MDQDWMKKRTKDFAKRIIKLCRALPNARDARLIGDQMFRAGTSVGANYRSACRGRSRADFIAKLGITLEEADECLYWLEILAETKVVNAERLKPLMREGDEIIAILVSSINTAKSSKLRS